MFRPQKGSLQVFKLTGQQIDLKRSVNENFLDNLKRKYNGLKRYRKFIRNENKDKPALFLFNHNFSASSPKLFFPYEMNKNCL